MARKFLTPIDLAGFDLQNSKAHLLASDPTGLVTGDKGLFWFNTTTNRWKYWNGSAAELKATDSDLLQGQNGAYYLSRTNQSGTQTTSTISDLAATVQTYRLDQFAAATSPITIVDGSTATHAATKGQLDTALASLASGQTLKGTVRAVATTNINIASAPASIDGITAVSGDVFLLTGQTTGTQNGPYSWAGTSTTMTRATNWDTSGEAVLGSYWIVREGTKADQFTLLTNDTAIVLGTSTPAFTFVSAGAGAYTGGAGLTLTGQTFDVGAGTGITVAADSVAVDFSIVGRKVQGIIPASTSGIFSVSGAVVTINHALNNWAANLTLRYYTSPGGGNTQGAKLEAEDTASDANNIVLTLPSAPSTNQYAISITG